MHYLRVRRSTLSYKENIYEIVPITSKGDCAKLRDQVASFSLQLHSGGHPGETIPLGVANSSHCSVCYQFHFIVASNDGWMEDIDQEGEPLSAEAAALALLAHYSNQATYAVAAQ